MTNNILRLQRDTRRMSLKDAALTYYLRMKETGDATGCVNACMQQLIIEHAISEAEASHIAINAYAEQKSINYREFIDIDKCTSHLVAIKTPTGHTYITLSDLMLFVRGLDEQQAYTLH